MTQTPSQGGPLPQEPAPQRPRRPAIDRWVKIGFLIVLVGAGLTLWLWQRRDPQLTGWGRDLSVALQQAKVGNRTVLVFFTDTPMSWEDKHAVKNVITTARTASALNKLACVRVHLSIDDNKAEARTYKIESTPTYLLLDSSGKELRRLSGLTNDVTFINTVLGAAES